MRKRLASLALVAAAVLMLSGCAAFNKDYVSVKDYVPSQQEPSTSDGKINVRNYSALRQALLTLAYAGETEGSIVFDAAYDGDVTEDMASACWAVRTQDALCAYCVENIAYELNRIVTISEASVYISYSERSVSPEEIKHLAFSSEAEDEIQQALESGERRIALLVGRSGYTADDMSSAAIKTYRANPTIVPKEPRITVNIYSGNGSQRLYEMNFNYGMTQEELEEHREQLQNLSLFEDEAIDTLSEADRAYMACMYLMENCTLTDSSSLNNAYAALVDREADSEGVAFAYVELCRQLGLECQIVYGQRDWQEHCWNIVKVDDSYYHVDTARAMEGDLRGAFLLSDERAWGSYRWDVAAYPRCTGELRYDFDDTIQNPEEEPDEPEEFL